MSEAAIISTAGEDEFGWGGYREDIGQYEDVGRVDEGPEILEILDFINKRNKTIEEPVLQFIFDDFPPEPVKVFEQFRYEYMNYKKLNKVVKDFQQEWETVISRLQEYEKMVQENLKTKDEMIQENAKTKDEILEDIDKFLNEANRENEDALRFIESKLNLLQDSRVESIREKLEESKDLFNVYMEALLAKKETITEQSDEDFFIAVLDEINLNNEWLIKQQEAANAALRKVIDIRIAAIVNKTSADMSNMCKSITKKIEELEEKLRLKRLEIAELRFRELKAKLSAELETLKSRKSFLDLQIRSITDLDNSLKELNEELRLEIENMQDTEEFFKNEIQKAMANHLMDGEEQIKHIQRIKDVYEKAMEEHKIKIRKIEEEREIIKKALLDEIEIAMEKRKMEEEEKMLEEKEAWEYPEDIEFNFDEFGRYFIDSLGRKIYNEDEESSAYIRDEFGNFIEIYGPRGTVIEAEVKLKDCEYLKSVLGEPLTKALGQIVLYQPSDPILYLAHWLLKYRKTIDDRLKRNEERKSLEAERERIAYENRSSPSQKRETSPHPMFWKGGESQLDFHLLSYKTPQYAPNESSLDTPQTR